MYSEYSYLFVFVAFVVGVLSFNTNPPLIYIQCGMQCIRFTLV